MNGASILQFLVITILFLKHVKEIKNHLKVTRQIIWDDVSSDSVESNCTAVSSVRA